jgi:uroporphyrinogen-III synthase
LVLRPEPGATATVKRAEARGLIATAAPLFTIVPLAWDAPDPAGHDALMLTSANAIRHGGDALAHYRHLPVYAVGEATAAAARAAGFADIRTGTGDAADLLGLMAAEGVRRPLHLAGREHRDAGHAALTLTRRLVYAADPVEALPAAARDALADNAVVLLHSARAAAVFQGLMKEHGGIRIAAISPAVAQAAAGGWRAVAVASSPDDAALLRAAADLA